MEHESCVLVIRTTSFAAWTNYIRCLDQLYRQRCITLAHGHVLRMWGERQTPPDPRYEGEASDHFLWAEVMERLDWPLRAQGIVL